MSEAALSLILNCKRDRNIKLDLSNLNISTIPYELSELTWIEELHLNNNLSLNNIEPLSKLINLKILYLHTTFIEDITPISELKHLQELSLHTTYVKNIHPLSDLKNLQVLSLAKTAVDDLSALSGNDQLIELYCHSTQISDLSPLSWLVDLEILYCNHTNISNISPILDLKKLKIFSCESTQVSDLTPIISLIKQDKVNITLKEWRNINLYDFTFRNCPLNNPPIEIVSQGNSAILNFLNDLSRQGEEKLYEAKIVVIGAGESGKTTLIKKLKNPAHPVPNPKDKRTEGINVTAYHFTGKIKNETKSLTAYLWDFGGQELYYATHQFFLTPDTLYILLNDNRKNDTDFYYWLNIVRLRAGENCPLIIIFNQKDKAPRQITIGEEIYNSFQNIVTNPIDIDLADKNIEIFKNLKLEIEKHFSSLEVLGKSLPSFWIKTREALSEIKSEKISWYEFQLICKSNGINDELTMKVLAQTFHNMGVLLYFPDIYGLDRLIILNSQWCIDAIYAALDMYVIKSNHGRFSKKTLSNCWSTDERFRDNTLQLLELMQHFDLCYQVEGARDEYIAPQLLETKENKLEEFPDDRVIKIKILYTFMPAGIIISFIARMSRHILIPHVWRTGVILKWEEGTVAEVIEFGYTREISIKVNGIERQRRLAEIRKTFSEIHKRYKGIQFYEEIACPCNDCNNRESATMYKLMDVEDHARFDEELVCRNIVRKRLPAKKILEGIIYDEKARVFISYSHKNENYKDDFKKMISPFERRGKWNVWDDRYILPGEEWNDKILKHLSEANVIVLLITSDFFNSDFIYNIEFSRAIQRHETGDALIIGIIVEDCLWEETPIRKIQILPRDGKPINQHSDKSEVWKSVAKKIDDAINAKRLKNDSLNW